MAARKQAMAPFMSTAPRPYSTPFDDLAGERIDAPAGEIAWRDHIGVSGEAEIGAPSPTRAYRLSTGAVPSPRTSAGDR